MSMLLQFPFRSRLIQGIFGTTLQILFFLTAVLEAPILLLLEKCIPKQKRPYLWRSVSMVNARIFFGLAGIQFVREGPKQRISGPVVYASNHPSLMDGFSTIMLFGPNLTHLIGPRRMFSFPYNLWMIKSGAIDVIRDANDERLFGGSPTLHKKEAIEALVSVIKSGESVFIFAEGHYERSHHLHYIHSGAARVAQKAQVPIVPITLVGEETCIRGRRMRPGKIRVVVGESIQPLPIGTQMPFWKSVVLLREQIRQRINQQLPHRYHRDFFDQGIRHDVAAFFDIDHTISLHSTLKGFFLWLLGHQLLSVHQIFSVESALIRNQRNRISHEQMMSEIANTMKGLSVQELQRYASHFYLDVGQRWLNLDLFSYVVDHQKCEHRVVLLSETIQPLAECYRSFVGAHDVFGTQLEEKNGRLTGKILQLMRANEKRQTAQMYANKHRICLKDSFAYADDEADLPLLSCVGNPIVIQPHQKRLVNIVTKKHWEVVE